VDNITLISASVKVTLNVSIETPGIISTLTQREEKNLDSKIGYDVMIKNMMNIKRYIDVVN
jgi:hypothetical protein